MGYSRIFSAQSAVLKAKIVTIETDISRGLHQFSIVGLPDKGVEESRDRVSAAIKNCGFDSPKSKNEKITIALAPAELRKEGPIFDIAIAMGYLSASNVIHFDPERRLFLGELALDGRLCAIRGALAIAQEARNQGFQEIFLPRVNAIEAALVPGITVYAVDTLRDLVQHLNQPEKDPILPSVPLVPTPQTIIANFTQNSSTHPGFGDIRGQESAKRGLAIAAAGGHNIALYGPPGTGKTLLAKALAGILPPLTEQEAFSVTAIHSQAGTSGLILTKAPFRAPHHTASYVSIIGGGATPKPGEVTLAHHGVLFLDEFPEFDKRVIESLREPLEEGVVSIARAKGTEHFPSRFILVAAMNPCPCGHLGDTVKPCTCSPGSLQSYKRKLSGPIVDRIDIWIEVPRIDPSSLGTLPLVDPIQTEQLRATILQARERQIQRFAKNTRKITKNSEMSVRDIDECLTLSDANRKILDLSAKRLDLSPRSYHRVLKLARTIADLADSTEIAEEHILEALQYRPKSTMFTH